MHFLGIYCTINSLEQSLHHLLGTEFLSDLFDANHKHIHIASVFGQEINSITHARFICVYTIILIPSANNFDSWVDPFKFYCILVDCWKNPLQT